MDIQVNFAIANTRAEEGMRGNFE